MKPVEAVRRAAAVLRGDPVEPFAPVMLPPMTDGSNPVEVDPDDPAPAFSFAVPRVVPSVDVPEMAVVGKPEIKVDAVKLAKGNPAFTDDIELRGMLYAKLLYSPHAHARILDIDDAAARAVPGVHEVLHYQNTPRVKYASGGQSWPNPHPYDQVSFDDKVRHVGDRVAVVAAETIEVAEAGGAPDRGRVRGAAGRVRRARGDRAGGTGDPRRTRHRRHLRSRAQHRPPVRRPPRRRRRGAGARPHRVFEGTFRVHQVQQVPIEPHISIAWLDSDERLVVRTATQVPFHTRRMLAPLVGLEVKDIRVIKPRIGGGFGAKQEMLIEDIVAHLAIATRRPVRLELTREEEFWASRTRHPQTITFRSGVDADGNLVAQDMKVIANTGAYGTHGYTVQAVSGLRGLDVVQLPQQALRLHGRLRQHPGAGRLPRLRRSAGRVRARGAHGGHRPHDRS